METIYFVLGSLMIISTALVVGMVLSALKINKMNKQLTDLETQLDRETTTIYRNMQIEHDDIWRQFEATGRDVTMVERTLSQCIAREIQQAHRHIEEEVKSIQHHETQLEQAIHREIEDTRRNVDSRIDKTILSGSMKSSKQTIN